MSAMFVITAGPGIPLVSAAPVTEFFASFETSETPAALSNNVVASQNMSPAMATAPANGPNSTADKVYGRAWDGTRVMRVTGTQPAGGNAYSTNLIYDDLEIEVLPNTQLSYVILPDYSSDATVDYSVANWDWDFTSQYISLDLEFTDGTRLSTEGGVDQYGHPMTGRAQGGYGHLYMKQWNLVKCNVGEVANGKVIKKIFVCFDKPTNKTAAAHTFGAYIDYLRIRPADISPKATLVEYANIFVGNNDRRGFSRGNQWPCIMTPNGFNVWAPSNYPHTNFLAGTVNEKYWAPIPAAGITHITTTHQASTFLSDFGTFQFMPNTNQASTATTLLAAANRRSLYDEDTMIHNPSYFSVQFKDGQPASGVKLELTPTEHAAYARMTFPSDAANVHVIFDTWRATTGGSISFSGNTFSAVTAHNNSEGRTSNMYIYGEFDKTPSATRAYGTSILSRNATSRVTFPAGTTEVNMKIATSFISDAQAQKNLSLEIAADATFDDVKNATAGVWNDLLGAAAIETTNEELKVAYYSAVMRTYADPLTLSENTGTNEDPVWTYQSPYKTSNRPTSGYKLYYNNGFWDTFRGAWGTYQLITPVKAGEMLNGLVQHYVDSNWIARWLAPGGRNSMVGTSSDIVLGDAVAKGLSTFDFQNAYMASLKNASTFSSTSASSGTTNGYAGRAGMVTAPYVGFTPNDTANGGNTKGLAWSIDNYLNDLGVSLLAEKLGNTDETIYFRNTSQNFVNLWNYSGGGWFIGKSYAGAWQYPDGLTFATSGNDSAYRKAEPYEETNGFTSAFSGFADFRGLANLYGGRDKLAARLDRFFTDETMYVTAGTNYEFADVYDAKMGNFGFGNQPDFHIPYVYTYAGQPYKTQKYTRDVCERLFSGASFDQLFPGDQDNGSMSGWYVMSSLGFFPFSNGLDGYIITSPLFDKITYNLPTGKIEVICNNNSHDNVYIQSMTVDGVPYNSCFITTKDLLAAKKIVFEMGPDPSNWACDSEPPSITPAESDEVPNPLKDLTTSGVTVSTTTMPENNHTTEAAYCPGWTNGANLFNNSNAADATCSSNSASIYYYFPNAKKVEMVTVTSAIAAPLVAGTAPDNVALYGSADGTNWVQIDAMKTGFTFIWPRQLKPFAFTNDTAYNYYRLDLRSSGSAIAVSEVELLGHPVNIVSVPKVLATGQTSFQVVTENNVSSLWLRDADFNHLTADVTVSDATVNTADGTKTFTVTLNGTAAAQKMFYITAADARSNEITSSRKTISLGGGLSIYKNLGKVYAKFENGTGSAVPQAGLIIAAYDAKGKMTGVFSDAFKSVAAGDSIEFSINSAAFAGCTFKAFAWDDSFIPICPSVSL